MRSARPRGGCYLFGRVVAGAGSGVPGSGAGVVGVVLERERNGWTPNSTSLSLRMPE